MALFDYSHHMSPNANAQQEELSFRKHQLIKVSYYEWLHFLVYFNFRFISWSSLSNSETPEFPFPLKMQGTFGSAKIQVTLTLGYVLSW